MNDKVAVLRRAKAVPPIAAISDPHERRLHMQAHGYWMSIARPGQVPLWSDFDPLMVDDRCTQSFVFEQNTGATPTLRLIGQTLKAEGGIESDCIALADLPQGSLLMRVSTFFPELIRRAVPLSVEADFETTDGRPAMYRGLLMPFSTSGSGIDTIFGVVSWRELSSPGEIPERPSARIIAIR